MNGNGRREAASSGACPVAILHAGGIGEEDEAATVGVDEGVALAAHDLLAGVVAARPAGFVGLHALAVVMHALGEAARPLRSRSIISNA